MGSSLMSARGYDSDAQYIGSPHFVDRTKASPRAPSRLRRTGLHDLIERSRERNNSDLQEEVEVCDQSKARETPCGIYSIPAPPESLRLRMASRTDLESADYTGSQVVLRKERVDGHSTFAESLPSFEASTCERQVPQHQYRSREDFIGGNNENLQNNTVDGAQYMEMNPDDYYAGSSTSLAGQAQGIMVPKRQLPTSSPKAYSEARYPHHGELDPPHRQVVATSMTSGPPSTNPSMLVLPPANRYGSQMLSQEDLQSSRNSGALTLVGSNLQKQDMHHPREVSSVYSRPSDNNSGSLSQAIHSPRLHSASAMDGLPNIQTQMIAVQNGLEPSPEVFKSRFIEQLDQSPKNHSMSSGANGVGAQRKVSPGWMTGGRRMGYGYSLVDDAGDYLPAVEGSSGPQQSGGWHRDVTGPASGQFSQLELSAVTKHQDALASAGRLLTPEQESEKVHSRRPNGVTTEDRDVLTPRRWARVKEQSMRAYAQAPLGVDLAGEEVSTGKAHNAVHVEHSDSPMSANVDYVEDTDEAWRALPAEGDVPTHGSHVDRPNPTPVVDQRLSIDQVDRQPSVRFDPSNNGRVQKLNKEPSRSRSGRWLSRFSRRETKRRSKLPPKEGSGESAVYRQGDGACSVERADSTRSDWAEELATSYQECIHMPGAFHGSGWASRTSLVVEAEP
ncbi:hypothetical protein N7535_004936 [Penicillium sp. DV-2018c]|nr:hypothetical protein N7461_008517 [Penicillium sp. DV-2018c]KAJ5571276.1 hypothetical protein N7535_004936 [Penicillium sp. DV-2018c]